MKTIQVLGLLVPLLVLSGPADAARVVTVQDVLDYTDNGAGKAYYFWHPDVTLDHSPYFRHAWEDWGWTHDVTSRIPADVNGILSATLTIEAWDVDTLDGEVDRITANNSVLGDLVGMPLGEDWAWTTTSFQLPAGVLAELLIDGKVDIFMNIDKDLLGQRVTIGSSTLEVRFTASGDFPDPNVVMHRFWSDTLQGHFYTISEEEKDNLIAYFSHVWTYEGIAYYTFGDDLDGNLRPVYRFWSDTLGGHFYTISEEEKLNLLFNWTHVWSYEGVAFYAYPEGLQPPGTSPVYRFWSDTLGHHFYTISEEEKQNLIDTWSAVWALEGVAWYAYN